MTSPFKLNWLAKGVAGLAFIGDPHVNSKNIGRRKDDYLESVTSKLEWCGNYCNQHNLFPLILGDLFHRSKDYNIPMLYRLTQIFKKYDHLPYSLEGNHDRSGTQLTRDDTLSFLELVGGINVISKPGYAGSIELDTNEVIHVYGVPYGYDIPNEVVLPDEFPAGKVVMLTHHDMAFEAPYPTSIDLKPVKGVDFVVNGHIHDTKPPELHGETWWFNPGNIEPLSVKHIHHVPKLWQWDPSVPAGTLVGHKIPHGDDIFDLTGVQVSASTDVEESVSEMLTSSQFASVLTANVNLDANKTTDGAVVQEDLEDILIAANVSEATKLLMRGLVQDLDS